MYEIQYIYIYIHYICTCIQVTLLGVIIFSSRAIDNLIRNSSTRHEKPLMTCWQRRPRDYQNNISYSYCSSLPPELQGKCLLLKTPQTLDVVLGEIELERT